MKTPLKVSEIPVRQLWHSSNWIEAERERYLTTEETTQLIADPAARLPWRQSRILDGGRIEISVSLKSTASKEVDGKPYSVAS